MQLNEEWRDIAGYEGLYQISNIGRIKSLARIIIRGNKAYQLSEKYIKLRPRNGYPSVGLHKNNAVQYIAVHRLVAFAFIENPCRKECINHKDCNRENNTISNLEWVSKAENNQHAWDNGCQEKLRQMMRCGIRQREVIQLSADGIEINRFQRIKDAAERLGINRTHISSVCKKQYGRNTVGGYKWEYAKD